ncbi:MAG: polysaccharide biosynthesis tyrosine autokinase [bacterium]|nr:polysaccharide biosynthesis tyrosine autokinase [bacterium]
MKDDNLNIENNGSANIEFDVQKLILILKKKWYWIPISIIISIIGSHYYLKYTKPVYKASSLIKLEIQREASNVGLNSLSSVQNDNLSGEIELIRSPLVAQDVLRIVDLSISYYAIGNIQTTEIFRSSPFKVHIISDPIHTPYDRNFAVTFIDNLNYQISEMGNDNEEGEIHKIGDIVTMGDFKFALLHDKGISSIEDQKNYYFRLNSKYSLVSSILSNLSVIASNDEARTIQISLTDFNKEKARVIVNAFDTVYLKHSLEKKQKSQEQTLLYIQSQIEETSDKLDKYENEIESFVKSSGTSAPEAEFSVISKEIDELEKNKFEISQTAQSTDGILEFIQRNESKDNIVPLVYGIENKDIANGINELNNLFKQRELLKISNKEVTLPYRKIELEISMNKAQILNFVKENKRNIAEQTALISKKIAELKDKYSTLPSKKTEFDRLKRFNSLYEKFYLSLVEKQIEYQISKAGTVPEFIILSEATVSNDPISPNRTKVWSLFIIIGVLPILLFILIKYLLMNVIYSQKQIENRLIAPILGSIPTYQKKMPASTLVVDGNPKSSISESLRAIRTNSDFMLPKKSKQIFGVTSTISGEGKTFFAINFAAILALTGKRVVVLDLDMRKPKIHVGFNVENNQGISSILSGISEWRNTIHKSSLKNLDFITSGPIPPNPNELLLKQEFDDLLENLHQDYDIIMADNPPIGLVTDANNVFKKCDLSIYVVRSGFSKEIVINNINNLYKSKNYTNLSVVINDVNRTNTYGSKYGNNYGYGNGYGYGYYEDDNENRMSKIAKFFKKLKK